VTRLIALRLDGAMQAWGGPVAGDDRPTMDTPTKSGVIGLIGGALGIERSDVRRLRGLHDSLGFVVRVDRAGVSVVDFQTIENVPTAGGKLRDVPVISRRGYLCDAAFTVLLVERQGITTALDVIVGALRFPRYLPYLGRRACVPSVPVLLHPGIYDGESWQAILNSIPPAEPRAGVRERCDVLADADLVSVAGPVIERHVRDVTAGTAPRFFDERVVRRIVCDTTEGWGV